MKKKIELSLIIKYSLLFITLILSFFITLKPKATEDDFKTTDKIKPLGARLRLDNFNCISFAIDFSEYKDSTDDIKSYGVAIALKLNKNYVNDGKTRKEIFNGTQIQRSETLDIDYIFDGIYNVIVKNIPKQSFDTTFYVLGYVTYENGDVVYSDTYIERSLTDVARSAYSDDNVGPIIGLAIENKLVKITADEKTIYSNDFPSSITKATTIELAKGEYNININTSSDLVIKGLNKEKVILNGNITVNSSKVEITNVTFSSNSTLSFNSINDLVLDNNIFDLIKNITINANKALTINNNIFIVNNLNEYVLKNNSTNLITLSNSKFYDNNKNELKSSDISKIINGNIDIKE